MEYPESHKNTLKQDNVKKRLVFDLVFCKNTISPTAKTDIAAKPTGTA